MDLKKFALAKRMKPVTNQEQKAAGLARPTYINYYSKNL